MGQPAADAPVGAPYIDGVVHRRSPLSVAGTVERLTQVVQGAGAQVGVVVDHSGEAERAGLSLRDTKLVVFGSPVAGTPVMEASPLAALDLPLKVLVWADDAGTVWMSYLAAEWLTGRHSIAAELTKPLAAPDGLTSRVAQV
jgi:uncharacterized protein (DUF302 family)